jgi:HEAT repeat protein
MEAALSRLTSLFQIRSNELGLVALVTGLLFFAEAGAAVGSPGIEALFYTRFGVEFLPVMYIILGAVTLVTSLFMTALMARVAKERLYVAMPLVMALLLIVARVLLVFDLLWFYPVLWLGMNTFWLLLFLFTYGLASLVCDTRQAKRLFPLFGVGGIVGLTIGSLLTQPLVNVIGTENLILVWAGAFLVSFVLAQRLAARSRGQAGGGRAQRQAPAILDQIRQGFQYVRSSELLRWISWAAITFAILYYAIVFPFAQAVTFEFSDDDAIAGFLGTFQGISTALAILASLFLANRLYARFGFMATILAYQVIYLIGFTVASVQATFTVIAVFRLVQIFWSEGISNGAGQAMFNVVPPEKREQSRTFVRGIANQLGISLAGVMLLLGDRILETVHIFIIGIVVSAISIYLVERARRAYGSAVVAALRAGQSHIFFSDEEPFGGFRQDATAVVTAIDGIHSQEVAVRRVSADILGNLSLPEATDAVVDSLDDPDASVRAALLRAIGYAGATPALLEVAAHLQDPDPEVRLQAVDTLRQLTTYSRGVSANLEPLIHDPDPAVRSRAAAALLMHGSHPEAESMLKEMATTDEHTGDAIASRILALEALRDWGGQEAYEIAVIGLADPVPSVREASARVLAHADAALCLAPLQSALADEDTAVREAVAVTLGEIGRPALDAAVQALQQPETEEGALSALLYLPARRAAPEIRKYEAGQVEKALNYHRFWISCRQYIAKQKAPANGGDRREQHLRAERSELLADSLRDRALRHGTHAFKAMAATGRKGAISLAIENLESDDPAQRANALETLDSVGDAAIVRPLLPLWETADLTAAPSDSNWLLAVLQDDDFWLRACAAFAAAEITDPGIIAQLSQLAENDPHPLVRESAALALNGDVTMDTLQTISTMERVLFLRRVPLFADLPPNDLMQIAAVSGEQAFSDGTIIAEQGESGDMMYIIVDGEVLVTAHSEGSDETVLGRRHPGEYVGEMAIISDEVRMASLVARGDVRTLSIDQSQFREILRLRPEASMAVMRVLSSRLRERG